MGDECVDLERATLVILVLPGPLGTVGLRWNFAGVNTDRYLLLLHLSFLDDQENDETSRLSPSSNWPDYWAFNIVTRANRGRPFFSVTGLRRINFRVFQRFFPFFFSLLFFFFFFFFWGNETIGASVARSVSVPARCDEGSRDWNTIWILSKDIILREKIHPSFFLSG